MTYRRTKAEADAEEEIGRRYGLLTVIAFAYTRKGHVYLKCLCDCGKTRNVRRGNLRSQHTTSCGHTRKKPPKTRKRGKMVMKVFRGMRVWGKVPADEVIPQLDALTTVEIAGWLKASRKKVEESQLWFCSCIACQTMATYTESILRRGHEPLCVCFAPTVTSWRRMLERCYLPSHKQFKDYGGRTPIPVAVCEAWRKGYKDNELKKGEIHGFWAFWIDKGHRPPECVNEKIREPKTCEHQPAHRLKTLHRIKDALVYEASTTMWATKREQEADKRKRGE